MAKEMERRELMRLNNNSKGNNINDKETGVIVSFSPNKRHIKIN
jgi:hypothetical protein